MTANQQFFLAVMGIACATLCVLTLFVLVFVDSSRNKRS